MISSITNNEISLNDFFIKLKLLLNHVISKWKAILFISFLGGAIGFSYSILNKPTYYAYLTYALDDEKGGASLGGALGLASSLGFDLGTSAGGAFGSANLMELMHSRSLIEKTLLNTKQIEKKKDLLINYYLDVEGYREKWKNKPELNSLKFENTQHRSSFSRLQDSVLGLISNKIDKDQLSISQKDKKVSIGTIQVKSEDEIFAKTFCETLVNEVSDYYIETKSKKAKMNVMILEKQSDSVRNELNNAINGVAIANDATYNLNPALNVKRTPSSRRQVDVQANTAILTQLVANLELARVSLRKETPLIQVIDAPIYPLKVEKIGKLKGIFFGGILSAFLAVIYFLGYKIILDEIKSIDKKKKINE